MRINLSCPILKNHNEMSKKSIDMKLLKENVKQGEKIELPKFIDHVSKGTIVDNFSILVGTQLLIVRAEQPGEILLPFFRASWRS